MVNEISTPAMRVAKGIAVLDASVPEWYNKIDLMTLNIAWGHLCIMGQLFGDYLLGMTALTNMHAVAQSDGAACGFFELDSTTVNELTNLWIEEIIKKRAV